MMMAGVGSGCFCLHRHRSSFEVAIVAVIMNVIVVVIAVVVHVVMVVGAVVAVSSMMLTFFEHGWLKQKA